MNRALFTVLFSALFAFACIPFMAQAAKASASAKAPKVFFENLKDGDTVTSPVHIKFGITGMKVAPAGTHEANTGHFHLLIDAQLDNEMSKLPIPKDEQHLHFGLGQTKATVPLKPGKHTLQIVMGDGNHVLHNTPAKSKIITVTVKPEASSTTAVVGQPAPDFSAASASGKTVKLSDFKGKTVVLEWTSNECPIVNKHYDSGNMQKLQKLAAEQGVVWLSVDSSATDKPGYMDASEAKSWIKKRNAAPADLLIDAEGMVGRLYGAKTTPHLFVIDKNGTLAYAGAIDSISSADQKDVPKATNYVQAALNDLNAGKPVQLAETKSYGCGIKYGK